MIQTDPFYLNEQISKKKMNFQAYVNVDDEGEEQTFLIFYHEPRLVESFLYVSKMKMLYRL